MPLWQLRCRWELVACCLLLRVGPSNPRMRSNNVVNINKIIHERARLLILTYLASSEKTAVSFNELQKELDFTPGNLSIQLRKLQAADYLAIKKTFRNNKPYTSVRITPLGSEALYHYVEEMETLIHSLKR